MSKRFLVLILGAACVARAAGAQSGNLLAGAARLDITPLADEFPIPLTSPSAMMPQYVGVHDPLYARALVLDDGSTEAAIAIVDLGDIFKHEEFKHNVASAIGIPETNPILVASHTHSDPTLSYHGDTQPSASGAAQTTQTPEQIAKQDAQWGRVLNRIMNRGLRSWRDSSVRIRVALAVSSPATGHVTAPATLA